VLRYPHKTVRSQTPFFEKEKASGFFMLFADALVKQSHFFGIWGAVISGPIPLFHTLGASRWGRLCNRHSSWVGCTLDQLFYHLRCIFTAGTMETSDEDYVVYSLDHESMDVDRDMPSVSPMTLCAVFPAHHLVC
jgi:hypothetical protein